MPIPFPREAKPRGQSASQIAQNIYAHIGWLARWSDELVADPDVDMKKLGQLAFGSQSHCHQFLMLTAQMDADVSAALEDRFRREGQDFKSDQLASLRQKARALRDAVSTADEWPLETRVWTRDSGERGQPPRARKPHPAMQFVKALRAEFA